ncbi:hypothetical protein DFH07DRAFT_738990 [Mycena maculata]|uniref:SET domain-containing protein n=1 Tax=Mycena maculata TaxID=230809 RepID=A0AAD7JEE8_9AGAR|nr:hypothetical protein DFH07DRAFT_738990 [Mycena maculata]
MRLPAKAKPNAIVIAEPMISQIISAQPNFPLVVANPVEPTYEIRATKNMGLGMFATRALEPGDLVLSERPVLVYPNGFRSSNPGLSTSMEEFEAAFVVAMDEMRAEDRIAYRKLAKGVDVPHAGDLVRIATANCFRLPLSLPGGPNKRWTIGDYRAVYLDISRINHSCSPNTVADFDFPSFSMVVRAAREIKPEEEISTTYVGTLDRSKAQRRQLLAFCMDACGCSVCTNPVSDASESRRMAIASYAPWTIVNHLAASIEAPNKLLVDLEQCLQNVEDEGLQSIVCYPMLLDLCGRLAGIVGNQTLADDLRGKAEMFYQMRAWYTVPKNFVEWVFEPLEGIPERVRWAASHGPQFQQMQMLNRWSPNIQDSSDVD